MKRESLLFGDALRQAAKPWLDELGKTDRDRLQQLLGLSKGAQIRLSEVLTALFPQDDTQAALANLTRLRKRINDAAKEQKPDPGLRFQVDTKKKSPPAERAVWFTGPDPLEADIRRMAEASTKSLARLPALITQQQGFVYNPAVDEKVKELDFAVLIALQEEFEYVYPEITGSAQALLLNQDTVFVFDWHGYRGGIAWAGKMGPQAMADLARSVLERFKPRLLCVAGIAGALDKELRLCDVLVADQAENYLHTAKAVAVGESDDFEFSLSGESFPTSHSCVATLRNWPFASAAEFEQWQEAGKADLDASQVPEGLKTQVGFSPKIAVGHIATGDIVGAAPGFGKRLRSKDRKLAAIEMESAGMLAAVHKHHPATQTLVLRGISDFADQRKEGFDESGGGQFRRAAMRNAFRLLLAALPRLLPQPRGGYVIPESEKPAADQAQLAARHIAALPHAYVPNDGCLMGVGEAVKAGDLASRQGRLPAADYILDWIKTGDTLFLAVLGEYGIGKTTTLKHVTQRLSAEREKDPTLPVPVFIDLRENYLSYKEGSPLPTLEALIEESVRRNWRLEKGTTITADEVLELVRNDGAVIIFDGLDEKIVHMDTKMAQGFIRELWRALPPDDTAANGRGKLILSCRSHYFPTLKAQRSLLCGEDREGLRDTDYRACLILPFSTEQIQAYLRGALGEAQGRHAWEVVRSIHNLEDLSARPYLLTLITSQIESLEKRRASGETVTAVTLYEGVVEQWLERDGGKHKFSQAHKRELMECLAADLWRSGLKQWPWADVERWLETFYAARPVWQARYAKHDFELLLEDLRTATFIVRPETSPEDFRFAHTSLQEYFLACYIFRALNEQEDVKLALPETSLETLNFLGQLLANRRSLECLGSLERVLGGDCLPAACLAFQYWLQAIKYGFPQPRPRHVNLSGAVSQDWEIRGRNKHQLLDLRGANLRGLQINRSRVEFVDVSGADLSGLQARQSLFLEVHARASKLVDADVSGLQWHDGVLDHATITGTNLELAELNNVSMKGVELLTQSRVQRGMCMPFAYSGHHSFVNACAWNPLGTAIVSASADGTLKMWDAATGRELLTLRGHRGGVSSCAWSPNGAKILSAGGDQTLRVWDVVTGKEAFCLCGHERFVTSCAWSPDGKQLLSGAGDHILRVWDAVTGNLLLRIDGHEEAIYCCGWSPDGALLVSGSSDKTLRIWDARTGKELRRHIGHRERISSCSWSPDGRCIVSGSDDKTLKIWDAATGRELLSIADNGGALNCGWSPDSRKLISGTSDHAVKVWDAASGRQELQVLGHRQVVRDCAWSPDGSRLLSASMDRTLKVWDAATGKMLLDLAAYGAGIADCAWSSDGRQILSGSDDGRLRIWDPTTAKALYVLPGHYRAVSSCAWSPDNSFVMSGSDDHTVKVWDIATRTERITFWGHVGYVNYCSWSPKDNRALSAGGDKRIKVWDVLTGKELLSIEKNSDWVSGCAWSPDGDKIVSGSDNDNLKVWDAQSGCEMMSLIGHKGVVNSCAWSSDGKRLLSASDDHTLKIWDATTGRELLSLSGHECWVTACAWSPDGSQVLSGSEHGSIKIWDAATGKELLCFSGHLGYVTSCVWSPDGSHVLSGGDDSTIKAWDVVTGRCLWTIYLFSDDQSAVFSGDGTQILHATPEAWRWLGWEERDARGRFIRRLPAEVFGPIPGMED